MPRLEPDDSLHAELDAHPADTDRYYIQVDGGDQTEPVFGWYLVSHLNVLGPILSALKSLFTPASAAGPASLDLHEDTDNGSSRVRITAPAALGADRTLTAPDADGTLARTVDITFETLDAAGDVGTGAAQVAVGNHAHPASAITSGTLAHERGGLEADVSAYDGVPRISGGATTALALGIANDALLQAKNTPANGEFARFTTTGIEGLTEAEFKAAANLEVGVDVAAAGAYAPGGTDVPVADGGTGVSTLPSGQLITGAGTSPVTGTSIPAGGLAGITALGLKADAANPVFTGTVTVPDGALAIADTSGLQAALDLKASAANPVFTGTVTVPDAALAIADTSGLQAALDGKQPIDADLTALAALTTPATSLTELVGPNAPILVTGDLTLVAATHHRKTLEISAATSPRITCAQIGAGVRVRIHRPITQPSPILLPPATTGVWLGGADAGLNRILGDGTVGIEYTNGNIPMASGDLQWGERPASATFTGLSEHSDLRRGEGLSTAVIGDPVSAWTSQGAASGVWSSAVATEQPTLNEDGTLHFNAAGDESRLLLTDNGPFPGDVIAVSYALRYTAFTTLGSRLLSGSGLPSGDIFRLYNSLDGVMRFDLRKTAGSSDITFNFTQSQWLCFVFIISIAQTKAWSYSNSRVAGQQRKIYTGLTNIPDWKAWASTADLTLGTEFTSHSEEWDVAHFSIIDHLDGALSGSAIDDDVGIRLLGQARAMLPPGADG